LLLALQHFMRFPETFAMNALQAALAVTLLHVQVVTQAEVLELKEMFVQILAVQGGRPKMLIIAFSVTLYALPVATETVLIV